MKQELLSEIAKICNANEDQLQKDIAQFGMKDFFARIEFLEYPDKTKNKLRDLQRLMLLANMEES